MKEPDTCRLLLLVTLSTYDYIRMVKFRVGEFKDKTIKNTITF